MSKKTDIANPLVKQYANGMVFLSKRVTQLEDETSDLKEANRLNKLIISDLYIKESSERWVMAYEKLKSELEQAKQISNKYKEQRDFYFNEVIQ